MQDPRMLLFFMTAFAGFVMVVGGMWLIYKQKIYIDKESNQPVEISLGSWSFKSNYPALALFVLGFVPLVYPFHELSQLSEYPHVIRLKLTGAPPTTSIFPATVYAAVTRDSVDNEGDTFSVSVPFIGKGDEQYKVLLIANDHVLDIQTAKNTNGQDIPITFKPVLSPPEFKTTSEQVPPAYQER